jgi:transcriptional regulator with XRE-family HTH domain
MTAAISGASNSDFGARLLRFRLGCGYTQMELSRLTGYAVSVGTIDEVERGTWSPSAELRNELARPIGMFP